MATRSTSTSTEKLYSSTSEKEWAEKHLTALLLMLGLPAESLSTITIDEIVDKCKEMYEPHPMEAYLEIAGDNRSSDPGFSFGRKQRSLLVMTGRRFWRRWTMATHEEQNGV